MEVYKPGEPDVALIRTGKPVYNVAENLGIGSVRVVESRRVYEYDSAAPDRLWREVCFDLGCCWELISFFFLFFPQEMSFQTTKMHELHVEKKYGEYVITRFKTVARLRRVTKVRNKRRLARAGHAHDGDDGVAVLKIVESILSKF